jgi:hypothetical protein
LGDAGNVDRFAPSAHAMDDFDRGAPDTQGVSQCFDHRGVRRAIYWRRGHRNA